MQTDTRSISQINPKSLVSQGDQVVDPINRLVDTVPFVQHWCHINTTEIPKVSNYANNAKRQLESSHRYSLDWHPADHVSFLDNVHLRPLASDCKVGS